MSEVANLQKLDDTGLEHNSGPDVYLEVANYLDPADPIDKLLIDFKEAVAQEALPTAAEQLKLVGGIKANDLQSARQLVASHQGLVAAVAYPFKCRGVDAPDLLKAGVGALIRAAKTYDNETPSDFSDHAVSTIHEELRKTWPELGRDSFVESQEQPMLQVYHFAETLNAARSPMTMHRKKEQDRNRFNGELKPKEVEVLGLIHLPTEEIVTILGVSVTMVKRRVASIRAKFGVELKTREAVAVEALKRGMKFDLAEIPGRENFSLRQRQVAMRLAQPTASICAELGLGRKQIVDAITFLYKKTGAKTRTELVLLAHENDFEPTEEEINLPDKPFMERMSPLQEDIFRRMLYMKEEEMAEELSVPLIRIRRTTKAAMAELEVANRMELVLELYRQGVDLDVIEPEEPLTEILTPREIEVIKNLHLPYKEIAEIVGHDNPESLRCVVHGAKNKTGARSRYELAVLVDGISDEEWLELENHYGTNRWRLAKKLGLKSLSGCNIDSLLLGVKDKEREVVQFHYLGRTAVSWTDTSEHFGLPKSTVSTMAARGIAELERLLEAESAQLETV